MRKIKFLSLLMALTLALFATSCKKEKDGTQKITINVPDGATHNEVCDEVEASFYVKINDSTSVLRPIQRVPYNSGAITFNLPINVSTENFMSITDLAGDKVIIEDPNFSTDNPDAKFQFVQFEALKNGAKTGALISWYQMTEDLSATSTGSYIYCDRATTIKCTIPDYEGLKVVFDCNFRKGYNFLERVMQFTPEMVFTYKTVDTPTLPLVFF